MSGNWKHRRRTDNDGDQHVDDWLMTYADMITLLLCFFAVFLAITTPDKAKFEKAKEQVAEKFATGNANDLRGMYALAPTDKDTPLASSVPFKALPSIVDRFPDNRPVAIEKGDRITTMEMNTASFFGKGNADLSAEGAAVLGELKDKILSPEYKDYMVSVEGYTDDIPIKTARFPSNWELSAARAASVVRELVAQGVPAERLRAVGFAQTNPKMPNRDANGVEIPENQAQNRRVIIRLEKITKQK